MNKERGLTFIGMLLTMGIVVITGIIIMKIIPVYIQQYSVTHSIKALQRIPKSDLSTEPSSNAPFLKSRLINQLDVNGVDIPAQKIFVTPMGGYKFKVTIDYKVIKPLVSNISLLFEFNNIVEIEIDEH